MSQRGLTEDRVASPPVVLDAAPRVVVIDDAPTVRMLMRRALPCFDIEVVGEAGDAQEGIARVAKLKPDVVLLDFHLPDRKGTEIIQELKLVAPETKIMMFTNDDQPETMSMALESGADAYVVKLSLMPDIAAEIVRLASGYASDA